MKKSKQKRKISLKKRFNYICSIQQVQYSSQSQYQTTIHTINQKNTVKDHNPSNQSTLKIKEQQLSSSDQDIYLHLPKKFPLLNDKTIESLYDQSRIKQYIQNIVMQQPPKLSKLQNSNYLQKIFFTQECLKQSYQEAQIAFVSKNINEQFNRCILNKYFPLAFKIIEQMNENQLNEQDDKGFSPTHLACLMYAYLKLQKLQFKDSFQLAKLLIYHPLTKINTVSKNGWNSLQDLVYYKIPQLSTHLFKSCYHKKRLQLSKNFKKVSQFLQTLDDFYLQIQVKINSYIPFVSNFTPTDTLKIYKYKNSLRLDYTLIGFQNLKCKRRQMSILFNCQSNPQSLKQSCKYQDSLQNSIIIINHTKKQYVDFFEQIKSQQMLLIIQDLLTHQMKKYDPCFQQVSMSKTLSLFGHEILQQFDGLKAIKHVIQAKYTSKTQKREPRSSITEQNAVNPLYFMSNFQSYTQYTPKVNIKRKNRNKTISLDLWLVQKYLIEFSDIAKIFNILGISHQLLQISSRFISAYMIKILNGRFPIKIQIPLDYSLYFQIQFKKITKASLKKELFYIPTQKNQYQKIKRPIYQKTLQKSSKRLLLSTLYTK